MLPGLRLSVAETGVGPIPKLSQAFPARMFANLSDMPKHGG